VAGDRSACLAFSFGIAQREGVFLQDVSQLYRPDAQILHGSRLRGAASPMDLEPQAKSTCG